MRIQVGILREMIRRFVQEAKNKKVVGGSQPDEAYSSMLLDDPAYKTDSVYVPNDIKKTINKWAEEMGLKSKKKRKNVRRSKNAVHH